MKKLLLLITVVSATFIYAEDILILAAASTTDVLKECAAEYEKDGTTKIRFNFASSGALARQIASGAKADIYIPANVKWMDFLEEKTLIDKTSRRTLFGNSMVLVAPAKSPLTPVTGSIPDLPSLIKGRIAVGNTQSVPCGMYAKEIFTKYNWLGDLQSRLVQAENVRQVLFFVERAEVDAGLVYATDAKISNTVKVISTFPQDSHTPILYPAALCSKSPHRKTAEKFLEFLSSERAAAIFTKYGFTTPEK